MKSMILAFSGLLFNLNSYAATPSMAEDQFCADRSSQSFTKHLTINSENLMAFSNRGGLINGGVCWWHSRFQRNALYLTYYKPWEAKPTKKEAADIIRKIRWARHVVAIPGFENFRDFSKTFQSEIQHELEQWQITDGATKFNWIIGLNGDVVVTPEKMKSMMDELYEYVELEGNIAYQKLQIKGIDAHAWLVVDMKKVGTGYDLNVLDSNDPHRTTVYNYREGMTSFSHYYYGKFTPYLERKGEMRKLKETIDDVCER